LVLLVLAYYFYFRDWIKPVDMDLRPVAEISYFNNKKTEDCETIFNSILKQCRGPIPENDSGEYSYIDYKENFEREVYINKDNNVLSISYYMHDKIDPKNLYRSIKSYVYINIFPNKQKRNVGNGGLLFDYYFDDVNSISEFKKYYTSKHGIFRPIFNLNSKHGKYGQFKYLISPFYNEKDEYGGIINENTARVDMYFSWDNYTIAINELTDDYTEDFCTPFVINDLAELLTNIN